MCISGDDAEDNKNVEEEMESVREWAGSPVDEADIIRAFEHGEEVCLGSFLPFTGKALADQHLKAN